MALQLRRATGTIHEAHLDLDEYDGIVAYFEDFIESQMPKEISAGAFALEVGEKTKRTHIQFYVEFNDRLRTSTLRGLFDLALPKHEAAFNRVYHAQGSWDYCSGTGRYSGKEAIGRVVFGDPKLYGAEKHPSLADMVEMVIDGNNLDSIMRHSPYAWAVHRHRIVQFYTDWHHISRKEGTDDISNIERMRGFGKS